MYKVEKLVFEITFLQQTYIFSVLLDAELNCYTERVSHTCVLSLNNSFEDIPYCLLFTKKLSALRPQHSFKVAN